MQPNTIYPDWIAFDWGTTNLRFWTLKNDGKVIHHGTAPKGMGQLKPDEFEPALLAAIGEHLHPTRPTQILCCGMVGSRQGWCETPYVTTPCPPPNLANSVRVLTHDPRLQVTILPGVKQVKPADVMRGEETQIAGVLLENPNFDGVICLPGTHTKWAHISAGEIVSFQTYMTGELFALLSENSILRHSMGASNWDSAAFVTGLNDAITNPNTIAAQLFSLRAQGLVGDNAPDGRSRLSGLLIGLEMAGAKPYWLGQNLVIVGADKLAEVYHWALTDLGATAKILPGDDITLNGLKLAYLNQKAKTE